MGFHGLYASGKQYTDSTEVLNGGGRRPCFSAERWNAMPVRSTSVGKSSSSATSCRASAPSATSACCMWSSNGSRRHSRRTWPVRPRRRQCCGLLRPGTTMSPCRSQRPLPPPPCLPHMLTTRPSISTLPTQPARPDISQRNNFGRLLLMNPWRQHSPWSSASLPHAQARRRRPEDRQRGRSSGAPPWVAR